MWRLEGCPSWQSVLQRALKELGFAVRNLGSNSDTSTDSLELDRSGPWLSHGAVAGVKGEPNADTCVFVSTYNLTSSLLGDLNS